jgi:hypothetical protein
MNDIKSGDNTRTGKVACLKQLDTQRARPKFTGRFGLFVGRLSVQKF